MATYGGFRDGGGLSDELQPISMRSLTEQQNWESQLSGFRFDFINFQIVEPILDLCDGIRRGLDDFDENIHQKTQITHRVPFTPFPINSWIVPLSLSPNFSGCLCVYIERKG